MKLDIVGPGEIADLFGVSKVAVTKWQRRDDFPTPDADLRIGPVWRRSTILRWAEKTGRRTKGATE